jgi:hypothetical protein
MDWHHEVWAEALWVEQNKGEDGPAFMAKQKTHLAMNCDEAGVARWRRIAAAYDQLRSGSEQ